MSDELMGDPTEGGEITPEDTQNPDGNVEVVDAPPERNYLQVDDPDSHYVRVKVDGEEIEVPFREALEGYSRTADYSRKTQELAEQRRQAEYALQLQQALEVDPEATLALLARRHLRQQEPAPQTPEFDDPVERSAWEANQRVMALEQRIAQQEADNQLNAAIGTLRQSFNANDEDVRTVVQTAYQNGLGLESFPMIYKAMQLDRLQARVQASQAAAAAKAAEEARRQAAAQRAGQVIATGAQGTTRANLTDRLTNDSGNMTFQEAVEAALAEHGEPI